MTLAKRMGEGRLTVEAALRLAMGMAESLRQLHEAGRVHGGLTPDCVRMTDAGWEILPAGAEATAYSAPELAGGKAADSRSDVFSFGAIVFEMLTGRRAYADAAATSGEIPRSGSGPVDRLLRLCLARDPQMRAPHMQQVMLELKLLRVAARRAAELRERADASVPAAEIKALEQKLESALDEVLTMRAEMAGLRRAVATAASVQPGVGQEQLKTVYERIMEFVERSFGRLGERVAAMEQALETLKEQGRAFERQMACEVGNMERQVGEVATGLVAAKAAMLQTDGMVERLVEALETLQKAVLGPAENSRPIAIN